jgi:hypothetical protein
MKKAVNVVPYIVWGAKSQATVLLGRKDGGLWNTFATSRSDNIRDVVPAAARAASYGTKGLLGSVDALSTKLIREGMWVDDGLNTHIFLNVANVAPFVLSIEARVKAGDLMLTEVYDYMPMSIVSPSPQLVTHMPLITQYVRRLCAGGNMMWSIHGPMRLSLFGEWVANNRT